MCPSFATSVELRVACLNPPVKSLIGYTTASDRRASDPRRTARPTFAPPSHRLGESLLVHGEVRAAALRILTRDQQRIMMTPCALP